MRRLRRFYIMTCFRRRTLRVALVLLYVLCVGLMVDYAIVITVQETDLKPHISEYHVTEPVAIPRKTYFNVIPTARDTENIVMEVPKKSGKGLPGRWTHHQGKIGVTSYKTSTVSLRKDRANVTEGQMIRITIQARDEFNRTRTSGGDFWYATLTTTEKGSTAGRVVDHANGTYSVYFYAGWSGRVSLDVVLVHPSEAVDYLLNIVWHALDRIVWLGRFEKGDKSSTRTCVLRRVGPWQDKCELSHPFALGRTVLLCDKPGDGLACDSLVAIYNNNTRIRQRAQELMKGRESLFGKDNYSKRLKTSIKPIEIAANGSNRDVSEALIPECEPDQPKPLSSGYWVGKDTWVSLACRTRQWKTFNHTGECLRNRKVYLLGDSTSRQWFEILSGMLGVPFQRRSPLEQNNIYRRFDNFNLTMIFKFHPLCLTGNPRPTPFNLFSFEVDVLDALNDKDCNYVVLVSPWAHYPQWTKDMFLERVSLLREAILRFRARCPDAPVVVKGSHPRDQPGLEGRIFYNNFMLYQLGNILRDTFYDTGAWFLDIWDMNLAYPHKKEVHMPEEVVKQELSMFLSYVCRKIK